jgi:hypothetical protein
MLFRSTRLTEQLMVKRFCIARSEAPISVDCQSTAASNITPKLFEKLHRVGRVDGMRCKQPEAYKQIRLEFIALNRVRHILRTPRAPALTIGTR